MAKSNAVAKSRGAQRTPDCDLIVTYTVPSKGRVYAALRSGRALSKKLASKVYSKSRIGFRVLRINMD